MNVFAIMATEEEIWKPIPEFDDIYYISNKGRVEVRNPNYRQGRGRILKGFISGRGYPCIRVRYRGKDIQKSIHRLLVEAFIPNPDNLEMVNHKDNNKLNFKLSNLEWVTRGQNIAHGYLIKGRSRKGWRLSTLEYLQKVHKFSTVEELLLFLKENPIQKLKINEL